MLVKCLILIVLEGLEQDIGADGRRSSKFVKGPLLRGTVITVIHISAEWLSLAVFLRKQLVGWSLDLFT